MLIEYLPVQKNAAHQELKRFLIFSPLHGEQLPLFIKLVKRHQQLLAAA